MTAPDSSHASGDVCRAAESSGIAGAVCDGSELNRSKSRDAWTEQRLNRLSLQNLTRDHLDYHGTMENYLQAKEILFCWPSVKTAVIKSIRSARTKNPGNGQRLPEKMF